MSFSKKIRILAFSMLTLSSVAAFGQDLIARQAPIDRKMRAVDSVALQNLINAEKGQYDGYSIYPNWNTQYVHAYGDVQMPDSFKIDLRGFCMPTTSRQITSQYGPRWGRTHKGLDVKVYIGDTIRAAFDGKVRVVRYERRGYGKFIVIRHPNGLETVYGHLSKQLVEPEQEVKAGDVIGLGGNTGRSTGSHLHFETRLLGEAINPKFLFDFENQDVTGDFYVYHKASSRDHRRKASALASVGIDEVNAANDMANETAEEAVAEKPKRSARVHKVKSGDTLSKIASMHGTTIAKLCKQNRIARNSKLRLGQIIRY